MDEIREVVSIGPECSERFFFSEASSFRPLRDLGVIHAGLSDLRGRYYVDRESVPFHVVLFTLAGTGAVNVGSERKPLRAGDLFVGPAHTRFYYELASKRWQILWFHLAPTEAWRALALARWWVQRSHFHERMYAACRSYLLEMHGLESDAERAALFYNEILALNLRRELEPRLDPLEREYRARFAVLWDKVNDSLAGRWTVAELSRRFGTSPAHFNRLCVEHCGAGPGEVVFRLRMRQAEELLRNTTQPLKTVAPTVGYENPFAFSAAFKRHNGKSPREYRKSLSRRRREQMGLGSK